MAKYIDQVVLPIPVGETTNTSSNISSNKGVHSGMGVVLILTTPAFTNDVTTNVQILDKNDAVLYQTPEQARSIPKAVYKIDVPISEQETFKATVSGAHGDDPAKSVTIDMAYIPD